MFILFLEHFLGLGVLRNPENHDHIGFSDIIWIQNCKEMSFFTKGKMNQFHENDITKYIIIIIIVILYINVNYRTDLTDFCCYMET